jgi:hypothetical protein
MPPVYNERTQGRAGDGTGEGHVKIYCYVSQGCGSEAALRENMARALDAEKISAEVVIHRIGDLQAAALKLSGSPSIFIDGKELQPQGTVGFS